jgi:glycine/D-amino acid oxidase-like deaminating enzyme
VLQLARDAAHFERQRRIIETFALPDELARLVSCEQGSALAGVAVAGPGWWLPAAGWADPASVCRANLAAAGAAVRCLFNSEAAQLRRAGASWEVLDAAVTAGLRPRRHPRARTPARSRFRAVTLAPTRGRVVCPETRPWHCALQSVARLYHAGSAGFPLRRRELRRQ